MTDHPYLVGDVVLTRSKGWFPFLIRLGAALQDKPNLRNHVVIVHHVDAGGTIWGIEGRPGGVGWVDMKQYAESPYSESNWEQPKTVEQRQAVATTAEALLQRAYDWTAIAADALNALHLTIWKPSDFGTDQVPGQVVCSALADYVYERVGLANPGKQGDARFTTPADWDDFIVRKGWQ